jgi:hypothetical protein
MVVIGMAGCGQSASHTDAGPGIDSSTLAWTDSVVMTALDVAALNRDGGLLADGQASAASDAGLAPDRLSTMDALATEIAGMEDGATSPDKSAQDPPPTVNADTAGSPEVRVSPDQATEAGAMQDLGPEGNADTLVAPEIAVSRDQSPEVQVEASVTDGSPESLIDASDDVTPATPDVSVPDTTSPLDDASDVTRPDGAQGVEAAAGAMTVRVYVAGESIEQWNRFLAPPFDASGALNNTEDGVAEYGWMVPFADRLHLRDPGLTVQWVGSGTWMSYNNENYSGSYPSTTAPPTTAHPGTTIRVWLDDHKSELTDRTHCYDVAFASRAGNDIQYPSTIPEATYKADLRELVLALDAGSNCRIHPIVYVTGHMPDVGRWDSVWPGHSTDPTLVAGWVDGLRTVYVDWTQSVVDAIAAENSQIAVRFVDMFTPFLQNQSTTAFPEPDWTYLAGTIVAPDLGKIHRDDWHPKRLASIYAGEIVGDGVEPVTVRSVH